MPNGEVEFIPYENGLHYLNLSKPGIQAVLLLTNGSESVINDDVIQENATNSSQKGGAMTGIINTVWKNYKGFTHQGVLEAAKVRHLQVMIGSALAHDFSTLVHHNIIEN